MQKNKLLTVLFSLIPGAGQMYLGFMKRGVSLMGLFCAVWAVSTFMRLEILLFALPVIWFYACFDAVNLNGGAQQHPAAQDRFLFGEASWSASFRARFRRPAGIALICLGSYLALMLALDFLATATERYYYQGYVSTFVIAVLILVLGVRMIRGAGAMGPGAAPVPPTEPPATVGERPPAE